MEDNLIQPRAKRRLTNITFEHEGAHVALVGKHQGGPANGVTTLIAKAATPPQTLDERLVRVEELQAQIRVIEEEIESLVSISEMTVRHLEKMYGPIPESKTVRHQPMSEVQPKSIDLTSEMLKAKYGKK